MPENQSFTSAEIRHLLEYASRADVRWKASRDLVKDVRTVDKMLGSCVQVLTDGFEARVQFGEYATVLLLEVLRRLNPTVADAAAQDLAQLFDDGQVAHERLGEWHAAVSTGQPMRLYIDVPEAQMNGGAPSGGAHVGRAWNGHAIEDVCPCPQEPCGLVDQGRAHPDCWHHPLSRAKSIRQGHPADQCPALEGGDR